MTARILAFPGQEKAVEKITKGSAEMHEAFVNAVTPGFFEDADLLADTLLPEEEWWAQVRLLRDTLDRWIGGG